VKVDGTRANVSGVDCDLDCDCVSTKTSEEVGVRVGLYRSSTVRRAFLTPPVRGDARIVFE